MKLLFFVFSKLTDGVNNQ